MQRIEFSTILSKMGLLSLRNINDIVQDVVKKHKDTFGDTANVHFSRLGSEIYSRGFVAESADAYKEWNSLPYETRSAISEALTIGGYRVESSITKHYLFSSKKFFLAASYVLDRTQLEDAISGQIVPPVIRVFDIFTGFGEKAGSARTEKLEEDLETMIRSESETAIYKVWSASVKDGSSGINRGYRTGLWERNRFLKF